MLTVDNSITNRQYEIIQLLLNGITSTKELSVKLRIKPRSVKAQLKIIYSKMHIPYQAYHKRILLISKAYALLYGANGVEEKVRPLKGFTPTEKKVLKMLSIGMTNREIADELRVSEGHIKINMVSRLMDKSGMSNRLELAFWYRQAVKTNLNLR